MTFDPKSLLKSPAQPVPPAPPQPMTIDDLAAKLAQISALGMGGAFVTLPDGQPVTAVDLVAHGEEAAHFVLSDESSHNAEIAKLLAAAPMMLEAFRRIADSSDGEMGDGDLARDLAFACILEATGEVGEWSPPPPLKN
ncbi:hypothetical protein [Massilia pseudoviolaceinigra]|uniref:hypothetical protein n=1 Tax=Massilia pseudoviolaceinigra TaxID=3057165 RepID=UPI002796A888|nr:hypothetical protein [Massilia sp. CCM 9206]MDQ1921636.1 hypothetical protein [Massilia sp. CCM 9206]